MTTATASDMTVPLLGGQHHFLLRRLHSLTGIFFGAYLIVHLLVNATLIQGGSVYQQQVDKIHSTPFLLGVEWVFIFIPFIYHAVYGLWITFTAKWNVSNYSFSKNWFYVFQRISAVILIVFIAYHVLSMKGLFGHWLEFDAEHATGSTVRNVGSSWISGYVIYPIGILASAYHTANGFWTAAITWGLTTSAAAQRRWGQVCIGLFVLLLGCGLLALVAVMGDASRAQELQTLARH